MNKNDGVEGVSGPVALVTGGSRGIGRAIVEALVADGWRVAFTSRSIGATTAAIESSMGGAARAFLLDLADRDGADRVVREVTEVLGPIAALVNNAGMRHDALLAMTRDEDWDRLVAINQGGVFRCCRAVLPGMIHQRGGAIVNVSSLGAIAGVSGQAAYAASKAAVLGLTRALAREMGRRNIRVNAVLPGYVPTDMTADLAQAAVEKLRATECLPRGTSAADVAAVVAFLASPRAAAMTGQAICVDAGASA